MINHTTNTTSKHYFALYLNTASLAIRVAKRWKILVHFWNIPEILETYQFFLEFSRYFWKVSGNLPEILHPFATLLPMMISSLLLQFYFIIWQRKLIFFTLGKSIKTQCADARLQFPTISQKLWDDIKNTASVFFCCFFFIANYCVELLAVVIFYLPQYVLHHIEVSFFCPEVLLNHHVAKCCFYLVQLCCDWQVYVNVHLLEFGKTAYARCDLLFGAQKASTANTINHLLVQNITSLNVCLCHFWPP